MFDLDDVPVAGWLLADRESAALAEKLLAYTVAKQQVDRDEVTIHADNGSSMASKPAAFLLADLGVTKTLRGHTSATTTLTASRTSTLKYRPDFPDRFGSIEGARVFCQRFFAWYNTEHYHSGAAWHQPVDVHYGRAGTIRPSAPTYCSPPTPAPPERFVNKHPQPCPLPVAAWINKPPDQQEQAAHSTNSSI